MMSQQVARRQKCDLATLEVASIHPYQSKPISAHSFHRCFFYTIIVILWGNKFDIRPRWCMTHTHIYVYTWNWNLKHLFINGCFNWMIPNHYMKDCCFTKHPFNNGCLGYQVYIHHNQVVFWFSDITTRRRDCNFFFLKGWVWSA